MMKQITFSIVLIAIITSKTEAIFAQGGNKMPNETELQENKIVMPEVGKPMPNFTLNNITHYEKTSVSLNDFRGKWVFLDFWFPGCVTCIRSFPKANEWQKRFNGDIEYILIGLNYQRYSYIEKLYERLRIKQNLDLPSAFDSSLAKRWGIYSMPDIYIINPNGILVSRTNGSDMTTEKIQDLIKGGHPYFIPKDKKSISVGINNERPTAFDSLVLFQSVLTEYADNSAMFPPIDYQLEIEEFKRKGYKAFGASISVLYSIAYTGQYGFLRGQPDSLYENIYPLPIMQEKDSIVILNNKSNMAKKKYNYSLDIPKENYKKNELMRQMQFDLKRYFGYDVTIEKRKMPVWILTANKGTAERLKTSTTKYYERDTSFHGSATGFAIKNMTIKDLMFITGTYLEQLDFVPFFDETGIKHNVNIKVDALMTDLDQVSAELQKNGLNLIQSEREMQVIVLRKE